MEGGVIYDATLRGGGGSKAVWNFSENSSVLEGECVPYGQPDRFFMTSLNTNDNIGIIDHLKFEFFHLLYPWAPPAIYTSPVAKAKD